MDGSVHGAAALSRLFGNYCYTSHVRRKLIKTRSNYEDESRCSVTEIRLTAVLQQEMRL